jgi:parvulin-like peptidyl-prolyl isomerase
MGKKGDVMHARLMAGIMVWGMGLLPVGGYGAEPAVTAETIRKDARETLEATRQYTAQQKEAFQQAAREELEVIQRQILQLQSKVGQASASARAELQQSINDLEVKKDATRKTLEELKSATDAQWDGVKSGIHRAIDELKQLSREALSRIP